MRGFILGYEKKEWPLHEKRVYSRVESRIRTWYKDNAVQILCVHYRLQLVKSTGELFVQVFHRGEAMFIDDKGLLLFLAHFPCNTMLTDANA